jgi:hypothetical protein
VREAEVGGGLVIGEKGGIVIHEQGSEFRVPLKKSKRRAGPIRLVPARPEARRWWKLAVRAEPSPEETRPD